MDNNFLLKLFWLVLLGVLAVIMYLSTLTDDASGMVYVTPGRDARGDVPAPRVGSMEQQKRQIKAMVESMAPTMFKEVLLSICEIESGFTQFDKDGNPTSDKVRCGHTWGAMRISDQPWARYTWIDYERIKWDAKYNVECGILIFLDKWMTAGRLKDERPGLRKISRLQVAIQLYYGLVPLKPGVDRWKYSRDVIQIMRRGKP